MNSFLISPTRIIALIIYWELRDMKNEGPREANGEINTEETAPSKVNAERVDVIFGAHKWKAFMNFDSWQVV